VPIFETVFAEGRGHGFQMMPLIQDIGQLKKLYGRDGYRTFLSGSEIQIFLPPRDLETAQELSDIAGRRTVVTESKSYSDDGKENTGYAETGRPVLYPQEIMALKPDEFIMVAPGLLEHVCKGLRWPYWELEDIAPLCDTNPYNPTVPKGFVTVECPHCQGEALRTNRGELNRGLGLPLDCRKCKKFFAVDDLPQGEFVKGRPSIDLKTYIKQQRARK
jgi:type IV secretory pathway TraG/TraD family ATPase VirD4